MLKLLGYAPLVASTAQQARNILDTHKGLRVALCDIMLHGGTSGTDFATEPLRHHTDLTVIFISGNLHATDIFDNDALRDCVLLSKPFCSTKLSVLLHDAFEKQD